MAGGDGSWGHGGVTPGFFVVAEFAEGLSPFEVTIREIVGFVEGLEAGVVFFVEDGLPGLGVLVAEVEAAAEGAGFAGGAEVVDLVGAAGGFFLGEELGEGDGGI